MSYFDPYADQYGGDSGYQHDQGRVQQIYGSEDNTYRLPQTNMWSEAQNSYEQDQENTYEDTAIAFRNGHRSSSSSGQEYGSSYRYRSDYKYPPIQPTFTDNHSVTLSKEIRPSLEGNPVHISEPGMGKDGFEQGEFTPNSPKKHRTPSAYRAYRYGNQGHLWTKGGMLWTIGRFCICTMLITLLLFLGIVLSLVLWMRPPNIKIGSVQSSSQNGTVLQTQTGGAFQVTLAVPISVVNFNYFDVVMKNINADIVYPINNTPIGGGTASGVSFKNGAQTNFTFPLTLSYSPLVDTSGQVLADIAKKCGALGGQRSDLSVNYKITLGIQVLLFTISPTVSNVFTFACPIQSSDIFKIVKGST